MIYTNSIEGYCSKPLSEDQIQSIKHTLHQRAKRKIVWLAIYVVISILAVMILGALIAGYEPLAIHPNGNQLVAVMSFSAILLFAAFVGGLLFKRVLEPYVWVTIAIHEVDMASSPEFFDNVEHPSVESLGSPLARKLVENIQKSERGMLVFERNLINKLNRI